MKKVDRPLKHALSTHFEMQFAGAIFVINCLGKRGTKHATLIKMWASKKEIARNEALQGPGGMSAPKCLFPEDLEDPWQPMPP